MLPKIVESIQLEDALKQIGDHIDHLNSKLDTYKNTVAKIKAMWLEHGCIKSTGTCDLCKIYELLPIEF